MTTLHVVCDMGPSQSKILATPLYETTDKLIQTERFGQSRKRVEVERLTQQKQTRMKYLRTRTILCYVQFCLDMQSVNEATHQTMLC